jgi:hypothetical protein
MLQSNSQQRLRLLLHHRRSAGTDVLPDTPLRILLERLVRLRRRFCLVRIRVSVRSFPFFALSTMGTTAFLT